MVTNVVRPWKAVPERPQSSEETKISIYCTRQVGYMRCRACCEECWSLHAQPILTIVYSRATFSVISSSNALSSLGADKSCRDGSDSSRHPSSRYREVCHGSICGDAARKLSQRRPEVLSIRTLEATHAYASEACGGCIAAVDGSHERGGRVRCVWSVILDE